MHVPARFPRPLLPFTILLAAALAPPSAAAEHATFVVGRSTGAAAGPFTTIQDAVDAASDGDTIVLPAAVLTGPGNKNVVLAGKNLTLQGTPGQTVIDCEGSARALGSSDSMVDERTLLTGITVRNGNAAQGGAMRFVNASPRIEDCVFEDCTATEEGGAIYASSSPLRLARCTLEGCSAPQGAGIWATRVSGVVDECVFQGNDASELGGALFLANSFGVDPETGLRLEDCELLENTAVSGGAGIYSEFLDVFMIDRCLVAHNSSPGGAGGLALAGNLITAESDLSVVSNSWIVQNSGNTGGGLNVSGTAIVIQNCTIAHNTAEQVGGLFIVFDSAFLLNTILWGNESDEATVLERQLTTVSATPFFMAFNDVQGMAPSATNISADPLFLRPATLDYHLPLASPCRNAGTSDFVPANMQFDIDGDPRILGGRIDMGGDEILTDYSRILPLQLR